MRNVNLVIIVILSFLGFSCEDFEDGQSIPSYIQVDTFLLVDNPNIEEGALTQNFTDVWVFVDDQSIGAFELPTEQIPVLVEGKHKLTIAPGVKYNGMSGTRGYYQFIELLINDTFNFVKDSIRNILPEVRYADNTWFEWKENFEQGQNFISLVPTINSDTSLRIYPRGDQQGNAGAGYLISNDTTEVSVLEVASPADPSTASPGYDLPSGRPVFLEIEYNTNIKMIVGLFIRDLGVSVTQHSIVVINPTDGVWKKMYVNLTPTISGFSQADYYYVFVRADYEASSDSPQILLDNLKLIYSIY
jgi:hypothetical protein